MIASVSALQSGFLTVRRGTERLDAAAAQLSTAGLPRADGAACDVDFAGALVELLLAKQEVGIGARVIARASDVEREVLDILA